MTNRGSGFGKLFSQMFNLNKNKADNISKYVSYTTSDFPINKADNTYK
jgi:hypothetical protein